MYPWKIIFNTLYIHEQIRSSFEVETTFWSFDKQSVSRTDGSRTASTGSNHRDRTTGIQTTGIQPPWSNHRDPTTGVQPPGSNHRPPSEVIDKHINLLHYMYSFNIYCAVVLWMQRDVTCTGTVAARSECRGSTGQFWSVSVGPQAAILTLSQRRLFIT